MWNDSSTIEANGISSETPSEPWICSARDGDVVEHLRHRRLDRRDVGADLLVVVVLVDRHAVRSTSRRNCSICDPRVGDHRLHQLLAGQQLALRRPRQRPLAHHVERLLDEPDGAHGVVDAAAAEAGLGDDEALAAPAEEVVGGDAHVVVADVAVRALPSAWP